MPNRYVDKLRGYAALTEQEVAALHDATACRRTIKPRRDLVREGDESGRMIVMLEGWAFRYKVLPGGTRQIMAILMPGDVGDLHGGGLAEMDHGIQTITDAQVAMLEPSTVSELMANPGIARALYVAQLDDHATLRAWIVSMGRRTSIERAASLLLELYLRAIGAGVGVDGVVDLPLSQVVLADALGMTAVHVNRVLQELRRSNALELERRVLRIRNPGELTRIAGFDDNYLLRRTRRSAERAIG